MTILGKIMAIFVFILALAWFFLTANLYATRAEWKKAYTKALDEANRNAKDTDELKKQLLAERANISARQQAADQAVAAVAKQRDEIEKKYTDLLATSNKVADAAAQLMPTLQTYNAAINKVQGQVDTLTTERATLTTERDKYAKDAQLATNAKNDAELTLRVTQGALEAKTEQVRIIQEARQANAVVGGEESKFRGEVTAVSKDGLIEFSGGLNAGVTVGKVYKVTRNQKPFFLGYVTVSVSDTKAAAGTFSSASPDKRIAGDYIPKVGDLVESK